MATLDPKDEAFFEQLSGGGAKDGVKEDATETYEVELTTTTSSTAKPKLVKAEAEDEEAWSDNEPEGKLTVDVYQTPTEIVVESAIAGVKPSDIDVNATADSVTIRGSRKREKTVNDEDYLYQECYWGRFARSIILPQEVDPDGAEVMFKNGILTVRLPKANKKKMKKLKIVVE
jgi:HSP20 family protein